MSQFLISWKSTLIGIASVVLMVITASKDPSLQAMIVDPQVQIALVVGLLGFVTKDSNVTGGSKGQPSTPTALMQANQAPSASNPPLTKSEL